MKQENKLLPGSLFCLLIGAAAWVMANYIPTVGLCGSEPSVYACVCLCI